MMPEPDFDQIALDIATRAGRGDILPHIKEALRQVWNARGAADLTATESPEVIEARGFDNADETHRFIQRAIRSLDR